jgi:hypothetical protein
MVLLLLLPDNRSISLLLLSSFDRRVPMALFPQLRDCSYCSSFLSFTLSLGLIYSICSRRLDKALATSSFFFTLLPSVHSGSMGIRSFATFATHNVALVCTSPARWDSTVDFRLSTLLQWTLVESFVGFLRGFLGRFHRHFASSLTQWTLSLSLNSYYQYQFVWGLYLR